LFVAAVVLIIVAAVDVAVDVKVAAVIATVAAVVVTVVAVVVTVAAVVVTVVAAVVVTDECNPDADLHVAQHILNVHRCHDQAVQVPFTVEQMQRYIHDSGKSMRFGRLLLSIMTGGLVGSIAVRLLHRGAST